MEISLYRIMLENQLTELESTVRNREAIAIEKNSDALDEVQRAAECDIAVLSLDHKSHLLRNVRDALKRMQNETYGVCLHCGEDISPKRLTAVPWTPYCIRCQERADRGTERCDDFELFEKLVVNAA